MKNTTRNGESDRIPLEEAFAQNLPLQSSTALDDWGGQTDERLAQPFIDLQNQVEEIRESTAALYKERVEQIDRRSTLFMLALLLAGVGWIQIGHPLLRGGVKLASSIGEKVKAIKEDFAPDLARTPSKGEKIARWVVTSPWGYRNTGIPGASTFHRGVDVDAKVGTPVYAIGKPGTTVDVRCWQDSKGGGLVASYETLGIAFDYLHLSQCSDGKHNAGSIIARSGDSGIGAAHFHFSQRDARGQKVPPQKAYLQQIAIRCTTIRVK
jgi:murein DD-endopeptidase MepM/ murein hydrolase activator NlpD